MTVKQGFEAIILLFDNAEADVTCRDALAKGVLRKAGLTSWTMLFVPAGLNCIGHLTRGRALLVAYQGPLTQPPGWEQQHPRAPMFTDLTTVAIPKFEHKADVFVFNATEHLRLLQLHLGYYHSKADGHEFSDNTYDELYVSYAVRPLIWLPKKVPSRFLIPVSIRAVLSLAETQVTFSTAICRYLKLRVRCR